MNPQGDELIRRRKERQQRSFREEGTPTSAPPPLTYHDFGPMSGLVQTPRHVASRSSTSASAEDGERGTRAPPWLSANNPYAQAAAEGLVRRSTSLHADDPHAAAADPQRNGMHWSADRPAPNDVRTQQTRLEGERSDFRGSHLEDRTVQKTGRVVVSPSKHFVHDVDTEARGSASSAFLGSRELHSPGVDGGTKARSSGNAAFSEGELLTEVRHLSEQLQERDRLLARALSESRLLASQLSQERALRKTEVARARQDTYATFLHILRTEGPEQLEKNAAATLRSMREKDSRALDAIAAASSNGAAAGGGAAGGGSAMMDTRRFLGGLPPPPPPSIHTSGEARREFAQMLQRSREKMFEGLEGKEENDRDLPVN